MRVLILNSNRERSPQTIIPLGACSVASAAKVAGHEVEFIDLTFSRSAEADARRAVAEFQPDVVGISVRNVDNCDFSRPEFLLKGVRGIAGACREAGAETIVVGGSAVTTSPGAVLRYLGADYCVAGEGERAFPALLRAIESGTDPLDVPGVGTAVEDSVVLSTPVSEPDLPSIPSPAVEEWVDLGRYQSYDASMPVQTKRGCMFRCSYCMYPQLEGEGIRLRRPEDVAADVRRGHELGFRSVEIVDSVFNAPEDHAISCCEAIASLGSRLPLQTLEFNPGSSSKELIEAMNAAGFAAVGCTAESGSDTMLESLGKGFSVDDLYHTAEDLKRLDGLRMWIFMLGGPGETEATVAETAKFIETALAERDLVYISCGIRILPYTGVHQRAVAEGMVEPDCDLLEPVFYFSRELTPERAMRIVTGSSFPAQNIVRLGDGNNRLLPIAQRLGHVVGLEPPFWRHAPLWNRARRSLSPGKYRAGERCSN